MKRRIVRRRRDTTSSASSKPFASSGSGVPRAEKKAVSRRSLLRTGIKALPYVIIAGIVIYILVFSDFFHIKKIEVSGPSSTLVDQLQTAAKADIQSNILAQSWWFLDTNWLADQLKKQFNQQEKVIVTKQFPNKVLIQTDEQTPALVWQSGGKYYLISVSGRTITEQLAEENKGLIHIVDTSNIPVASGTHIASKEFINFAQKTQAYFSQHNLGPAGFTVAETTTELSVKSNQGYYVKFDTTQDVDSQLRSLSAVLDNLAANKKKPAEYIDLRVPEKAFYK